MDINVDGLSIYFNNRDRYYELTFNIIDYSDMSLINLKKNIKLFNLMILDIDDDKNPLKYIIEEEDKTKDFLNFIKYNSLEELSNFTDNILEMSYYAHENEKSIEESSEIDFIFKKLKLPYELIYIILNFIKIKSLI